MEEDGQNMHGERSRQPARQTADAETTEARAELNGGTAGRQDEGTTVPSGQGRI